MAPYAAAATLGTQDPEALRIALLDRRERLRLEVDVAGFLNPLVDQLVELFPDARFILTIRSCFEWLESRIDQRALVLRDGPKGAEPFVAAELVAYGGQYEDGDHRLEQLGLPPVRGLLRRWATANERVLRAVPSDRLLVVRTEDLDRSHQRIAAFAGCAPADLTRSRLNQRTVRAGVLDEVDASALRAAAIEHCGPLMERYWGPTWMEGFPPDQASGGV
jgi:hypothetical protein